MKSKTFFGRNDGGMTFGMSSCHGYKNLVIEEDVQMGEPVKLETGSDGETLRLVCDKSINRDDVDEPMYMFLCKEFGLYDFKPKLEDGMYANVSIIYLDDGWMLVTMYKGTLLLDFEGDIIQPIIDFESCPTVHNDSIFWVNQEELISFRDAYKSEWRERFPKDFEMFFTLSGGIGKDKCSSFRLWCDSEKCIDLSLGYIAMLEEQQRKKNEAKEAKKISNDFISALQNRNTGIDLPDLDSDDDIDDYEEEIIEESAI